MHHIFFIHPSIDGHLGCFHILTIVNNASINVRVHIPFQISVFSFNLYKYLKVELLDHMVLLFFNFLRNIHTVLHGWQHQFTFPQILHEVFLFSTPLLILVISCLFDNSHSNRCEVISQVLICISLMISDVEHLFIYLLAICI